MDPSILKEYRSDEPRRPKVRRLLTIAFSLSLTLALSAAALVAQEAKKDEPKKDEPPKVEEKKVEEKKEAPKGEEPPKSIPPEVQAKIDAARVAVAEAIVAAQDAGLLETTVDPPPILDLLILGRATDIRELKKATAEKPEVGLYPEAFGAYFTAYAKMDGIDPMKNVRIVEPSKGLIEYYNKRSSVFKPLIAAAKKAKDDAAKPKEEPKKEEPKKEEPKKEEPKPEPKPEEKKVEEPKKEEAPKADAPKAEAPKEEPKKDANP